MNNTTRFCTEQLTDLVGCRIVGVAHTPPDDFGDEFVGLICKRNGREKIVYFLRDDEGNGPGSFEIQNMS